MRPNNSPWIKQLNRSRPVEKISEDAWTDIVIVGGGIAGITTAYFILTTTDRKVMLIEGDKVAHGATGHNAGQMTSYFERQVANLAKEFGTDMAVQAQLDIDSAWLLLEKIYRDAMLATPFHQFTGYAGLSSLDEILIHLENYRILKDVSTLGEQLMIAEESDIVAHIPKEYEGLYLLMPQRNILALLETKDPRYIAAISARKGVMNSALFTEELAGYLMSKFEDRFGLHEESFVNEVVLGADGAHLHVGECVVNAKKVVLCTNGFEKFNVINKAGKDINVKFHHLVQGSIGYMAAYVKERDKSPIALSYLPNKGGEGGTFDSDPYFYLTRRPFEHEGQQRHNLISVGGPDVPIEDTSTYSREEHIFSEDAFHDIDTFIHATVEDAPQDAIDYTYHWHGLMGYTPNGVRLIGEEPLNPVLMYNLGCNGVGILPSIYGGRRIARIIAGEKLDPSIFDPNLQ